MNFLPILISVIAAVIATTTKFPAKYDNFDIKPILSNQRLYKQYLGCLMDQKPCTEDGKFLKGKNLYLKRPQKRSKERQVLLILIIISTEAIPNWLREECKMCTENQRKMSEELLRFLIEKHPEDYAALKDKYDENGDFKEKYEKFAADRGIELPK